MTFGAVLKERVNFTESSRDRLFRIVKEKSVRTGDEYTLASGKKSNIFFDMKKTMLDPEGANLIADQFLNYLEKENVDFVGGLVMGAVPIVSAVCVKSFERKPIAGFFVRKEAKAHGTRQQIDGHIDEDSKVIMFDDVTTTGGSVLQAIRAVRERNCIVEKVITIVDREEGAKENLEKEGISLIYLFRKSDFV